MDDDQPPLGIYRTHHHVHEHDGSSLNYQHNVILDALNTCPAHDQVVRIDYDGPDILRHGHRYRVVVIVYYRVLYR